MTNASVQGTESQWLALAAQARDQARRAHARAARTRFPYVGERFEQEAKLNLALARTWSDFAERERALASTRPS